MIDEIQRVPSLLNEVHRLIEDSQLRFALSGSSARKLKRGGSNLLAGRADDLRLFPLLPEEIGSAFDLDSALRWGTLPAVWLEDAAGKKNILRSYVSTYLREEIQAEGYVRNLPSFSRFLNLAAESIAQEVSYANIARETSVTSKTIREYFGILEDTLVGFLLPPWTRSIRKQLAGSPKFYFFDNGVTNALRENLSDRPNEQALGSLFEQWVIQSIRAVLAYRQFEGSIYFWRARGGREVDVVIAKGSKPVLAIEIKSTRRPDLRDCASLVSFREEYPKVESVLVTRQPRAARLGAFDSMPAIDFLKDLARRHFP